MSLYEVLPFLTSIFARRFVSSLIMGLPSYSVHEHYVRSLDDKAVALYVHIPYCLEPLCRFCCFVRYPLRREEELVSYAYSLSKEIEWYYSRLGDVKVGSIYFGGGTPTINISILGELIDLLRSFFGHVPITVESNPRTLVNDGVEKLRKLRINRLSIGIQSFQEWRLRRMGRYSLPIKVNEEIIRNSLGKFDTVNIDMVWGILGDTEEAIVYDALRAFKLGVDQVTFYPIMPPPMKSKVMPDYKSLPIRKEIKLYKALIRTVISHGYRPDTPWCMSKISKGKQMIDEYVTEYYDFVGVGLSSIGKIQNYVYVNTFNPSKYHKLIDKRGVSVTRSTRIGKLDKELFDIQSLAFGLKVPKPVMVTSITSFILWSLTHMVLRSLDYIKEIENNLLALYSLHLIQKTLYTGMNTLREIGMRKKL